MESGLIGEDGLDVQYPVEVDSDQGQDHVTTPAHNMEGTTVQEIPKRVVTVIVIPVLVSSKFMILIKAEFITCNFQWKIRCAHSIISRQFRTDRLSCYFLFHMMSVSIFFQTVHGGWTIWDAWTTCSVSCAGGSRSRSRSCTNPTPQHGGNGCEGDAQQNNDCNSHPCPSK